MANANLIKVVANKIDGLAYSPSIGVWVNPEFITSMTIGDANGAVFRYAPPTSAFSHEYRTDTAASAIAVLADA